MGGAAATAVGWVLLSGALLGIVIAVCLRATGSRQFGTWQGGGEATFVGIVACFSFLGFCGAALLQQSAVWAILALLAWLIGYRSRSAANRRKQQAEDELRRANALKHPGIFDKPAPVSLTSVHGDSLELYEVITCMLLGIVNKSDISVLIDAVAFRTDQDSNDIFFMPESFELIPACGVSEEFTALIKNALTQRDYLILRWMPCTDRCAQMRFDSGGGEGTA